MDTDLSLEQQLRAQIDRLRDEFPDTQDLYREVCVLLFFRHGVTPTANRLYQLVRKGSMTAPAEALSKFWDDLRQKSRLRIEHPDLPEDLKEAAGALTAALWSKAVSKARDDHQAYRDEIQAQIAEARVAVEASADLERDLQGQLAVAHENLQTLSDDVEEVRRRLAAESSGNAALAAQLDESRRQNLALQASLDRARADFSVELEKQRSAVELAEERCRAVEQRALLEIDRERKIADKLQKEVDIAKASALLSAERKRAEIIAMQAEIGNARQLAGELKGSQEEISRALVSARSDLEATRIDLVASREKVGLVEAESFALRLRIVELEKSIAVTTKSAKGRSSGKKIASE